MKNIDFSFLDFQNAKNLKEKYCEILGVNSEDFSANKLSDLELGVRATHVLLNLYIRSIEDLLNVTPSNVAYGKNCGVKTFNEINKCLLKFFKYDYMIEEQKEEISNISKNTNSINVFLFFENLAHRLTSFDLNRIEEIKDSDEFEIKCIELCNVFEDFLKKLTSSKRDAEIFRKRIKIDYVSNCTLECIGKDYCISRERTRQIIERELRRISSLRKTYQKEIYLEKVKNIICSLNEEDLYKIFSSSYFDLYNIHYVLALLCSFFGRKCAKNIINKIEIINKKVKINEKNKFKILKEKEKLRDLIYFPNIKQSFRGSIKNLSTLREVNFDNGFITGYIETEKASNKLQYESGSERKILKYLDNNQYVTEINVQCVCIPYGKNNHYYPDIVIKTEDNNLCIIEVKPFYQMALFENQQKFIALHNYCKEKNIGYLIIDERFNSILKYKNLVCDTKLEKLLLDELNILGKINFSQYKRLLNDNGLIKSINELATVVFHNKLKWKFRPFSIEK